MYKGSGSCIYRSFGSMCWKKDVWGSRRSSLSPPPPSSGWPTRSSWMSWAWYLLLCRSWDTWRSKQSKLYTSHRSFQSCLYHEPACRNWVAYHGPGCTHSQVRADTILIPPSSLHHVAARSDSKPLHKVYLSPPTDENAPKLKEWLLNSYSGSILNNCTQRCLAHPWSWQ